MTTGMIAILFLTDPNDETRRVNAFQICDYYRQANLTMIRTTRGGGSKLLVKETPEQIDRALERLCEQDGPIRLDDAARPDQPQGPRPLP